LLAYLLDYTSLLGNAFDEGESKINQCTLVKTRTCRTPWCPFIALAEEPMPEQRARMLVVLPARILLLYRY
jgi:hypothetical protein